MPDPNRHPILLAIAMIVWCIALIWGVLYYAYLLIRWLF
jgi:hypothetical protein